MRMPRSRARHAFAAQPDLRSFVFGLVLLVFLSVTVLSLRPGGLRRQLRFAARRLRIILVLGGIYVFANAVVRVVFRDGPIVDWGPPALAVVLALAFVFLGQDPAADPASPPTSRG
jgi:hypothetical protein